MEAMQHKIISRVADNGQILSVDLQAQTLDELCATSASGQDH
jgi:hypothetical protein